jgi:hypothetical protein
VDSSSWRRKGVKRDRETDLVVDEELNVSWRPDGEE